MKLLHLAMGFAISAASFVLPAHAVDVCSPTIASNQAAAGVCNPICTKAGDQPFTGNWSNDIKHPPVKACLGSGKGKAFCECGTTPVAPAAPAPAAPKVESEIEKICKEATKLEKEYEKQKLHYPALSRMYPEHATHNLNRLADALKQSKSARDKCWLGTHKK